ncbi:MAG TPA: hypothetical protein VIJ28_22895 [Chloroflexota bacterium]|jgi:hypothetical protein
MREWVVIALAGAFGGIVAILIGEILRFLRTADTTGEVIPKKRGKIPWMRWVLILFLNALGAAVASYLLWATYTSSLTFESRVFTPAEVAASIIVGLGGTGALQGYMHEREEARTWKQTAGNSASAFEMLDQSEEGEHTETEGETNDRSE